MKTVARGLGDALALAGSMAWEILWARVLGFALSAVVRALVRKSTIVRLLGDGRPRALAVAAGLAPRSRHVRTPSRSPGRCSARRF
jgi:hypothetical protein